jgi:hypothetical protein
MSGIIDQAIAGAEGLADGAEAAVEAVVGDAEAFLLPRPGGKIDTARRQRDAESLADQPVAGQDYLIKGRPVAVDHLIPAVGMARTVTLGGTNPVLPLLPRDTSRRSATVLAVDNDVYLSNDPGQATTAANIGAATASGVFYLPKGIAVPWQSTDQLWAGVTTTATNSRVSVMTALKGE